MSIHNHINQMNHPKYNGDPFTLLYIYGGINMETLYNLGSRKQQFDYRSYPVPYDGESIVGLSRARISDKV